MICVGLLFSAVACAEKPENKVIQMSTTTSVNDSGLMAYLQPVFEKETGYTLEITSAGTGAAIEKGRTGDADILLVHSKSQEEAFIGEGFDETRIPFMYNFFVIVGPADDPAGVAGKATAAEAFQAIVDYGATFISAEMRAVPTTKKRRFGPRSTLTLLGRPGTRAPALVWALP